MRFLTDVQAWISGRIARLPPTLLLWLVAGALTALFAVFGVLLALSRADVREAAWTESDNLVAAVSQRIDREIELLSLSLLDVEDGAEREDVAGMSASLRHAVLFNRAGTADGLGALFLLDADGRLTDQAGVAAPPPLDFSRHAFFLAHRQGGTGLQISEPFVSLIDGEPVIALSRPVVRAGHFAGVAVATIKVTYFQELFSRLNLGPGGTMSLFGTDGRLILRKPFLQAAIDKPLALPWASLGMRGNFDSVSPFDGVERQVFYQRIDKAPLVLFLGRSLADIYAHWWVRTIATVAALFLLGNAILLLVVLLMVELRRRRAAERDLAVLASTDALTGLANRRALDQRAASAWDEARTAGASVALLLIDLDHFKLLNDRLGHQGGDATLAAVGSCLRAFADDVGGFAARYGGEEFAVLLVGAADPMASAAGEALRRRVYDLAMPHPGSTSGRLTASVGVAVRVATPSVAYETLFAAADRALYDAKDAGRNVVRVALPARRAA